MKFPMFPIKGWCDGLYRTFLCLILIFSITRPKQTLLLICEQFIDARSSFVIKAMLYFAFPFSPTREVLEGAYKPIYWCSAITYGLVCMHLQEKCLGNLSVKIKLILLVFT